MELDKYFKLVDYSIFYRSDYPDIDVIRVEDTYYCITTTMHFFPGAEILSSKDMIHWQHETYVYDTLDSTEAQRLENGNIYGKGMWAASLRYHDGRFYVCFVANDTGKTYLYTSEDIKGTWNKQIIEGFYHDCSLLFDDDGRVYIIYGNKNIYIKELNKELTAPKEEGFSRLLVSDGDNPMLGYEGTTALKINGTYYFFFIHSKSDRWRRVEACFYADSLDGELTGGDIFDEDLGYKGAGIAQGCIVDTPDGKWFGFLFQDRGAVGRTPVLMPVHFEGKKPVFDSPLSLDIEYERADAACFKEDFLGEAFDAEWQWNHEPELSLVELGRKTGGLRITSDRLCNELVSAKNVLTRRLVFPECEASVSIDCSMMNDGDTAGIAALLGNYGAIAVKKENGKFYAGILDAEKNTGELNNAVETEASVRLSAKFSFGGEKEYVVFFLNGVQLGNRKEIKFELDHFTGCRAALFMYSTKETGGSVLFGNFILRWERK